MSMGLFNKGDRADRIDERAEHLQEKARASAAKRGVDVTGALAVAHDLQDDAQRATFIVYPDRVEIVSHGKMGSMLRAGAGVETIPVGSIASVDAANAGI